ncbi:MauE/DoxX family redox-associated membrane protein [Planomonospora corallina]|uniref:MauE/DoxX family redox-associated membrane protein n=1 Tax=Planomonospora corallina TaxID=1806052 RepID=A0ABV8IFL3_9ACTN
MTTEMTQMGQTIAAAQIPVLVVLLALGTVAKIRTVRHGTEPGGMSGMGPAVLVPERWRAPVMLCCAGGEAVLAGGLAVTGHPLFRWGTVMFFSVSTYVLWELRRRRPDVGCGCFGEVSSAPVGVRSFARTVVLTAMAAGAAWTMPASGWSVLAGISRTEVLATAVGLLLVAALSPEIEETAARFRHRAPCEERSVDPAVAAARLRSSTAWRSHRMWLSQTEPVDSWRELCWRFFAFPGRDPEGEPVEVVFAVYLNGRKPAVRVALVRPDGEPVTTGSAVETGSPEDSGGFQVLAAHEH